jgi:4-amino-4-deoxy-L-arabinose transferase-like glycosyltransferase
VASVYYFTRKMISEETAFWSGMVLVSSLFVVLEFHLAVPDPYLIFFLTWSWLSFAWGWQSGKAVWFYTSYAAVALAFLAKGPVAIVLAGATCAGFLFFRGEFKWSALGKVKLLTGVLIFITLVAPWWTAITLATNGEWVKGFLLEHNIGRFSAPYEDHGNIPGIAVLLLFMVLLPLSGYLPNAFYKSWQERKQHPLLLMCVTAVSIVLLFFSLSRTLLPNYVGPAVPVAAILIGWGISRQVSDFGQVTAGLKWMVLVLALILSGLVPLLRIVIAQDRWIGDLTSLALLFLPVSLGAWLAAGFLWANRLRLALISFLMSFWLTGVVFFYGGAPLIFDRNPVQKSLDMLQHTQEEIIAYRFFNSAYVFNLQRTFLTFWDVEALKSYCAGKRIVILSRDEDRQVLEKAGFYIVFEYPYLFEGSTALVLTNTRP